MSWTTRAARSALTVARREGEPVTYTDGDGVETQVDCVLRKRAEPMLVDGQLSMSEYQWSGQVPVSQLDGESEQGDTITTARGDLYSVEYSEDLDGMRQLTLRER